MILVTGASASFGRETAEELLAAGCEVRALSRKPARLTCRPETLAPALRNVSGIFLALPYGMDAAPLLKLVDPGTRVVFLSSGAVDDHAASQPDAIAAYHAGVEQGVAAATPDWTFLRIFFPAINSLPYAIQLKNGDTLRIPCPDAVGKPAEVTTAVEQITGRPCGFAQWVADHVADFS